MSDMTPFSYAGFYDVPRYVTFRYNDRRVLLVSSFNEKLDEYPDSYSVYVSSNAAASETDPEPFDLSTFASETYIGEIPISQVNFDESRRKLIDASFVKSLFEEHGLLL
jgi:hypothetical protein